MCSFKKCLLAVVLWLLFIAVLSAIIIGPYLWLEANYQNEPGVKGKIDMVFCGSSVCQYAFYPRYINEKLGTNSYVVATNANTLHGRRANISAEKKRNPLSTVVIELSMDSLYRDETFPEGDINTLTRLPLRDKIPFIRSYFSFSDVEMTYGLYLLSGLGKYRSLLTHNEVSERGFIFHNSQDMTFTPEQAAEEHDKGAFCPEEISARNIDELNKMLSYCRENIENVIVTVVPVSDSYIWANTGWDESFAILKDICEQHDVTYFDFNLLKERDVLLSDKTSYNNKHHMSTEGAKIFSEVFAEVMQSYFAGEDTSDLFYGSYEELKAVSPYMQYIQ